MKRKWIALIIAMAMTICGSFAFASCSQQTEPADDSQDKENSQEDSSAKGALAAPDMSKWNYNRKADVFYQTGIVYCSKPADESIETLSIFVPGPYMGGKKNDDGTYTCEVRDETKINGYTALTAPVVMPVDTPEFAAQQPLTEYTDVTAYTKKGFIYVHAGCRGAEAGAPAGVTDLKAIQAFADSLFYEIHIFDESFVIFQLLTHMLRIHL